MKKNILITGSILILIFLVLVFFFIENKEKKDKMSTNNDIDISVNLDNGDEKIDWDSFEEKEITLNDHTIEIDEGGIYTLKGNIDNGSIIVNTNSYVKLILDNINIKNDNGPAIIIESANTTVIELKTGTENYLEDGKEYKNSEYDGCIFSRDDLVFQGIGTLNIKSNYLDGIVSNDDLKIITGTYIINSNDDGIRGKDSVYIKDGTFTIKSNSDGIKSTNDSDIEKGYINIEKGNFIIESGEDAFQSNKKLIIYDGTYTIKTTDSSSKALKSVDSLVIKNGTFKIDSKDDAIHSNNYVGIENGIIEIISGNDVIHADNEIIVNGGTVIAVGSSVTKSISSTSKQYSLTFYLDKFYEEKITLEDNKGKEIVTYNPEKQYSFISSSKLKKDETYTLKINGKTITTLKP